MGLNQSWMGDKVLVIVWTHSTGITTDFSLSTFFLFKAEYSMKQIRKNNRFITDSEELIALKKCLNRTMSGSDDWTVTENSVRYLNFISD